jgi:hypothetical protein
MAERRKEHVARALESLAAAGAVRQGTPSVHDQLTTVADLAAIARLLEELAEQTRRELAEWLTVGAHLQQAQSYATDLARCLGHACSLLAFDGAGAVRGTRRAA